VILLCLLPGYWVEQPVESKLADTAFALAAIIFLWLCWPVHLTTDQFGVSAKSIFPFKRRFIPWKEIASVEHRTRHAALSRFGIDGSFLYVNGMSGKRVAHTPLHGDRARFEHELRLHGAMGAAQAGDEAASEW